MYFHMDKQLSSPKIRTSQTLPSARSIPSIARARLRPPRRARRAHSPSDARRLPRAFASPRSSRPSLSLSPLSRVFGAVPGDSAFRRRSAEDARKTSGRTTVAPDRVDANAREGTRKNIKISRPRRVARRVHRAVASASLSARIDRETGAATDRSPIFWDANHSFPSARGRARGRHTTRRRGREIRSDAERRHRSTSRARGRWKRGARARGDGRFTGAAGDGLRARGTSAVGVARCVIR